MFLIGIHGTLGEVRTAILSLDRKTGQRRYRITHVEKSFPQTNGELASYLSEIRENRDWWVMKKRFSQQGRPSKRIHSPPKLVFSPESGASLPSLFQEYAFPFSVDVVGNRSCDAGKFPFFPVERQKRLETFSQVIAQGRITLSDLAMESEFRCAAASAVWVAEHVRRTVRYGS